MDTEDVIKSAFGVAITFFLGWWSGKKEKDATIEDKNLKNIKSKMDIYEKFHSDMKNQLEKETSIRVHVTKENNIKERENQVLKDRVNDLEAVLRSRNKLN